MSNDKEYFPDFTVDIRGHLVFPNLVEPNTRFNADGLWEAHVAVDNKDATEIIAQLEELHTASVKHAISTKQFKPTAKKPDPKDAGLPYTEELDHETEEETGRIIFKAARVSKGVTTNGKAWTATVPLFDAAGKPITGIESIRGGTEAVVRVTYRGFYSASLGCGVSGKNLKAVQIINLRTGGGASESFAAVEGGGYVHEEDLVEEAFIAEGTSGPSAY